MDWKRDHGACWRCRYFDRSEESDEEGGFCRRHPPVPTSDGAECLWVGVGFLDWCGEFEEDGQCP